MYMYIHLYVLKKEYMYIYNIYNIYKIYNQKYIFQKYEIHIHMYNFIQIISRVV